MMDNTGSEFASASTMQDLVSGSLFWLLIIFLVIVVLAGIYMALTGRTGVLTGIIKSLFSALTLALLVGGISVIVFLHYDARQEWNRFAGEHCKVIEKRDGTTSSGVGISLNGQLGVFSGSSSGQTAYQCDDGVTYVKND